MKDLLQKHNMTLYSTKNEEKSIVCERWNRKIKTKMWKQFTVQSNTVYLDRLPKILKQYNNTKHSSITMTLYSTKNEEKSIVCERWNRKIKTKKWKQFTVQSNTVYLDRLPKILKQYNNTKNIVPLQ